MGSDTSHDEAEAPLVEDAVVRIEDEADPRVQEPAEVAAPTTPPGDGDPTLSGELDVLGETLVGLQDVVGVMQERIDLLGREVDDIWMALRRVD